MWKGFQSGILSPLLEGQTTFEKYYSGCRVLKNFIPHIQGAASNRTGFRYISAAKHTNKHTRLVPFDFSTEQAYILEFGDQYIRFYMERGQIKADYDVYTKILLHFNGAHGSTTITESANNLTVTVYGDAKLTANQKRFGTASLLLDGVSDCISLADSSMWDFTSGVWTVDTWIYIANTVSEVNDGTIFSQKTDTDNYIQGHKSTSATSPDSYTKLLLHCNGADGSTNIIDETGKVVWANGGAHLITAVKKFGTASISLDGVNDYLIASDSADWDFSGGEWTFDAWIYFDSNYPPGGTIFSQSTDLQNYHQLSLLASGSSYTFFYTVRAADVLTVAWNKTVIIGNGWHHVEITENGDDWYLFIDGVLQNHAVDTSRADNYTGGFTIGAFNSGSSLSDYFRGYLDEIRVSKGVARHVANFTPETAEYPYQTIYTQSFGLKIVDTAVTTVTLETDPEELSTGWHHIAFVEDSNEWYIFVDGALKKNITDANRGTDYTGLFYIGKFESYNLAHGLDEFRMSNGIARWTTSFQPPIVEYTLLGGTPYEIATAYTEEHIPQLQFCQSNDILYIVHPNYPPAKLERTGHTSWTLSNIDFFKQYHPTVPMFVLNGATDFDNLNVTAGVDSQLTTKMFDCDTNAANDLMEWDFGAGNEKALVKIALYVAGQPINGTFDVEYYDTGTATWEPAMVDWNLALEPLGWIEKTWASAGAYRKWRLIKTTGAVAGGDVMELELYELGNPASWGVGTYPSSITFYEQRLWLAYSQTVWASCSGDFYNMTMGVDADNAIEYTIAAQEVNQIQWLNSGKILSIGTAGGEYRAMSTSTDEPITPLNIRFVKQSSYGSDYKQAIPVSDVVFYLQRSRRKIREFAYNSLDDIYVSPDMTLLVNHLFDSDVNYLTYQQEPASILWGVKADGTLIGLTYSRAEGVTAWHTHETDGQFKSIACIYGENGLNELWAVVTRTINGATARYIEMLSPPFTGALETVDCCFLDSSYTYSGSPITTVTGLEHLEGKTVNILADGIVHPQRVVASGNITLESAASVIQIGLPYESILQTMRVEAADGLGTAQGRKKRISRCTFRLYKTKQFKYGANISGYFNTVTLESLFKPGGGDAGAFDKEVDFIAGWDTDGHIMVYNDQPLPITIVAIIPDVGVS